MVTWRKIATMIIAVLVLGFMIGWIYSPGGLFEGVKEAVEGLIKVDIGGEELGAEKPTIPPEHEEAIDSLVKVIKQMVASGKPNCFANYGGLPELGEKGTTISFRWREDKKITEMVIGGGVGGKQEVSFQELDFKPCVIAGKSEKEDISDNFYYKRLEKDESKVKGEHYSFVPFIGIKQTKEGWINLISKNRIDFGQGFQDLEDKGWLYTPDGKHVCFFPTVIAGNDKDGLNSAYFKKGEGSIFNLLGNKLSGCIGEFDVYYLEHQDDTWRENLEWKIIEREGELEMICIWDEKCGYDIGKRDIEGYPFESEDQINFAERMASIKKWSEISDYKSQLSPEERIVIRNEEGKEINLNLLIKQKKG